jgi:5-methylcytosine-specific restriction endonuclease McrA
MTHFEFLEDRYFFITTLCNGDTNEFDRFFLKLFDFRDPIIKRKELDVNKVKQLLLIDNQTCQLKISKECLGDQKLQVEHLIPVSTNKLNKSLRNLKASPGKKVPTQSFGSNHISNLVLACEKCNSLKKHRLPDEFPNVVDLIKENVHKYN